MKKKGYGVLFLVAILVVITCAGVSGYSPGETWTARRLVEQCDALVFGTIEGAETAEVRGRLVTEYRFAVREVHLDKQHRLGGTLEIPVLVPGGAYTDKEGRKRKWRSLNAPELEAGGGYFLFLKHWQEQDGYVVVGGEAGAFIVDPQQRVLDQDGNAILDVREDGFIAVPGKDKRAAREQERRSAPPAGIVEDLSGARRAVKAASGSAFDQEYDEAKVLKKDAFILKVLGGRP